MRPPPRPALDQPLPDSFFLISRARTDITFYASSENPTIITSYISSVPFAELDTLGPRFRKALARIVDEGIDMSRMKSLLERQALQLFESMETDASEVLSQVVVTGSSASRRARSRPR